MRYVLFCLLLFLVACQSSEITSKTVDMYNGDGDLVGTAALNEQPDGVQIKLKLEGLEPGFHGVHVHEIPKCEGPDFKSAGNHFDPEGKEHGLMHPDGAHLGDLPNVEADGGGLVDADLMLAGATLKDGKKSILSKDGTSLVVTEGQDDGVSQPGGDSGARLICGEISSGEQNESKETPTDPTQLNEEQE
ncbi:superoxide dismutase family protein [Ornithinibacillus halophilus]|uniref:Superoxide dismutase, Cu-Zn family n=1 Tax=Ornithinibacillus halophilus TaxID=930117 RepID=A0A1M5NDP9_9BACI|nr:superoxide dismutase family protein [Ornithinibacillus halophilus]SHG87319.1 superoxide dismutase, Cu-Zn family [Ornithinibacillus halophilus]